MPAMPSLLVRKKTRPASGKRLIFSGSLELIYFATLVYVLVFFVVPARLAVKMALAAMGLRYPVFGQDLVYLGVLAALFPVTILVLYALKWAARIPSDRLLRQVCGGPGLKAFNAGLLAAVLILVLFPLYLAHHAVSGPLLILAVVIWVGLRCEPEPEEVCPLVSTITFKVDPRSIPGPRIVSEDEFRRLISGKPPSGVIHRQYFWPLARRSEDSLPKTCGCEIQISETLVQYFEALRKGGTLGNALEMYVRMGTTSEIAELAAKIAQESMKNGLNEFESLANFVDFVKPLHDASLPDSPAPGQFPVELCASQKGTATDLAVLLAALLQQGGYGLFLFRHKEKGTVIVAVNVGTMLKGKFLEYKDARLLGIDLRLPHPWVESFGELKDYEMFRVSVGEKGSERA